MYDMKIVHYFESLLSVNENMRMLKFKHHKAIITNFKGGYFL